MPLPYRRSGSSCSRRKEDMETLSYEKILQDLEQFLQLCSSLIRRETKGRFAQYHRAIAALIKARKTGSLSRQDGKQLDRYLIALLEGTEVSLMLPYLQQCEHTTIYSETIKKCLAGPFMPSDENSNSNKARNIQFELFLASTLRKAGLQPVLDEPDLKCCVEDTWFFFACKRLFSPSPQMLRERIQEAADQIQEAQKKALSGTLGIIAISLARVLNPSQAPMPILNELQGRNELRTWLTCKAEKMRDVLLAILRTFFE
jgi:hypothetical protein